MEWYVTRKFFKETYTIGILFLEDQKICDTLEDRVRVLIDLNKDGDFNDEGEGKIYGETAIPYGRYQMMVTYSPKLKRRLPILLNVPGYSGIRIHKGVSAKSTLGCILVGDNVSKGRLSNGAYYEDMIIRLIDEAIRNGEKCWITIN